MKYSIAALASIGPHASLALVGVGWSFSGSPSGGMSDVTFPINMDGSSYESGYYYAQQFTFQNSGLGYTGLQPRPDSGGNHIVHGVFSSFIKGTTTDDSNCSDGADGGDGVSCSVDITGDYSHTYNLVVENSSGTTWKGSMVDTTTGTSTHIGSWTIPSGTGGIENSQGGFIEYYPWNSGTHQCGDLPKSTSAFYNPTSKTSGSGTGTVDHPYEYGDCVGKVAYSFRQLSGGYSVTVGF